VRTPPDDDLRQAAEALQAMRGPITRLISARVERRRRGATLAERMSPSQGLTLQALNDGPLSMGDLAAATGVAVSTATRMVQGLERAGLVERADVADADRRRRYVGLTAAGRKVLREVGEVQTARLTALLAPLDAAGRRAILEGARALTEAMAMDERRDSPER
jgi:DNA-binding MarR family transcriptional regulator